MHLSMSTRRRPDFDGWGIGAYCCAGLLALALLPALWPTAAAAHTCDDPFSTVLIAGQDIVAGDVKVCNDADTLFVTYDPSYPWCLLETNLHVATIPDPPADPDANIPQNRPGNPKPDEFAYGDDYGGCHDGPDTFPIDLAEIADGVSPGDTVVIAAHAEVFNADTGEEEGAWGEGTRSSSAATGRCTSPTRCSRLHATRPEGLAPCS